MPDSRNDALRAYHRWLHHTAYRINDGSVEHEDLAQEGYIAMWRALPTHDPAKGSLPSWLTGAALLRMTDFLRRGNAFGREPQRGVVPWPRGSVSSLDAIEGAEDLIEAAHLAEGVMWAYHYGEIAAALDVLTDDQRTYVIGRFWKGLSDSQIAPYVSVKAVAALWHGKNQARDRLRKELAHLGT